MNEAAAGIGTVTSDVLDVLYVEDDPQDARLLIESTRGHGNHDVRIEFTTAELLSEALALLAERHFHAIALDLALPDARGLVGVQALYATAPDVPIIVVTGLGDEQLARRAIEAGAQDYLVKGRHSGDQLIRSISYAVQRQRLQQERDATASLLRQRAEQLLAANAKLTAAADARDELLAVVSHELRTPLTPILGFAELLLSRVGDRLTEQEYAMLRAIERNTQRMESHVEQLLSVSSLSQRPDDPFGAPEREDIDVAGLVAQLVRDQPSTSTLHVDVPDDVTVHANRRHVEQILSNLVVNAAKYGEPPIDVHAWSGAGTSSIVVADHGAGVPVGFRPQLFDRFSQASTGTRRTASGIGLGLYLSRQLARLHRGDLAYDPSPSSPGARFVLTLPSAGHPPPRSSDPQLDVGIDDAVATGVLATATRRMLHADDERVVAGIVEDAIHALGGVLVPIEAAEAGAIELDVSLGLHDPLLPVPTDELSDARLRQSLPILLEDARTALALVQLRRVQP